MTLQLVPANALCFDTLASELESILYKPDTQAFRIMLAAVAAHTLKPHGYPPVWLMVIGPSGSGKTTLHEPFRQVPNTWRINNITPNTFLSGYNKNGNSSLLHKLGSSPILLMKDFTTILSMRYESKSEIMGQLREIYDGYYRKATGTGIPLIWEGRMTLLTCCTPAIDQDRLTFRFMGDRFMEVRWEGPPSYQLAEYVSTMKTAPDFTALQGMVKTYLTNASPTCPLITPQQTQQLSHISDSVATLRTPTIRDSKNHSVLNVGVPESPTRICQSLVSVALASAAMDHSPTIRPEDMDLAIRLAKDSIPSGRLAILRHTDPQDGLMQSDAKFAGISRWTRRCAVEDLEALDIIHVHDTDLGKCIYWNGTPQISPLLLS